MSKEHQFKDKFVFYRFHDDAEGRGDGPAGRKPSQDAVRDAQQKKDEVISTLTQLAPDAVLKAILRKPYVYNVLFYFQLMTFDCLVQKTINDLIT